MPGVATRPHDRPLARVWSRWPTWSAWAALVWSLGYAVAGALWWAGADWYPFAEVPLDRTSGSPLERVSPTVVGPAFVVGGVLGAGAAAVFLRGTREGATRLAVPVGATLAVTATALVPDYTMIAVLAMWPVFLVFAFTGIPGDQAGIGDILYWHRVNLVLVFLGGVLWAAATLAAQRRRTGACVHCGRRRGEAQQVSSVERQRLLRLGRRMVRLAVLATVPYDLTRLAWFFGWPLGLSDATYRSLQDPPELLAVGLGLAVLSTGGALLTHGLVARWGEVFPAWVPRLAGRRVPVWLAVAPAAVVTLTILPASVMFAGPEVSRSFAMDDWGTWLPSVFWVLWAVGLGGAAWAYYRRRRGACRHCADPGERAHG